MGSSAIPAAVMARDPEAIRAALVSELVPVIASNVDPQTWDPRELPGVGGNAWQAVIWQERLWFRDEDSLTDHDEITCIRLLDGIAYLTNDIKFPGFVLSRTIATPPDEEDRAYGDTHRVPAGATDDWAGHENDDAMWTARGYRFRAPVTGDLHYVVDEAGYEHFSADDEWEDGFGALVFENGTIRPNSLLIRGWSVENETTNTLPATGPAGEQYIVGPSPTGAAAGQAKKIAWRPATDAAFIFTTPFVGEKVYDKATQTEVRWTGTVWQSSVSGYASIITAEATAAASIASTGSASPGYAFSPTTPPTSTANRSVLGDPLICPVTADYAGQLIEADYVASQTTRLALTGGGSLSFVKITAGIFVDSEVNARDWHEIFYNAQVSGAYSDVLHASIRFEAKFRLSLADTSAHTLKVIFFIQTNFDAANLSAATVSLARRRIIARKLA